MSRTREGTSPSLLLTEIVDHITQCARPTTTTRLINEEKNIVCSNTETLYVATTILTVHLLQVAVQKLIAAAHTDNKREIMTLT